MEQHIAELLKQNQELILALQRTHGSSQKVTVQFEKFDEENENFDSFFERFQTYLDVKNIPADSRAKDCQVAFEQIKKEICSPKVLVHYDPQLPITLASDASPVGVGCVLAHIYPDGSERPIAFAYKTLSKTEQKYSQIDKEALAIVWAVKKFHLYLKGRRFTLVTDHKPLVAIFGSKRGLPVLTATRLLHYALILQSFQFDIVFRKTADHGNADFLSRLPKTSEELEVKDDIIIFQMTQIETLPVTSRELRQETGKDELGPLLRALREGRNLQGREGHYTIEDGCILYGQRVCIPKKYQKNVLDELHTGHLGMVKMKALARCR
ncbi:Retrovirus-related Pol polyprotein from transposon 17.6 [Araneus ventricosus]|uniref:Retrovirus-related Pol polyprotein from transposon 17.6 n=1 Tax=Araneus ventricosus TaxID=182803 RepID=A0A4Y2AHB7_ARAVE|nr:Retrovirus-related Pol polyprotein from transposon 17.6 [Araneus ventricosus]